MSTEPSQSLSQIIALEKDIEDPGSGATLRYHVVRAYSVMMVGGGSCSATFASFISRAAFEAGKTQLAHVTVPLQGLPTGDVSQIPHWLAEHVLADETVNALTGAVPVFAVPTEQPAVERAA
jgi:hypothetical protein